MSTKVWYRAGIELPTPGSAVRHASVARHVTNCATRPGIRPIYEFGHVNYSFAILYVKIVCSVSLCQGYYDYMGESFQD